MHPLFLGKFRMEIVLYSGEQTAGVCAYHTSIKDVFLCKISFDFHPYDDV